MIPLWVDCDPGHDDALALLLACALPYYSLIGVSTVFGNASLDNTTNNAMALLTAFHELDIQVFPGAEKPLVGLLHVADRIHGRSGLAGTSLLPLPVGAKQPDHTAVAAMAEAIQAHPGEIAVVATGPLTNIALLVLNYPELLPQIRFLSIMGGGINMGNWTKYAEFNIWSDPKAADIVLQCPQLRERTLLVPINLTHQITASQQIQRKVQRGVGLDKYTVFRQMMYELLTYFADSYRVQFGFTDGPPVHDPLAVAALLPLYRLVYQEAKDLPDLSFSYYTANVQVTTEGRQAGKITATSGPGTMIAENMDPAALWDLVFSSIDILENRH